MPVDLAELRRLIAVERDLDKAGLESYFEWQTADTELDSAARNALPELLDEIERLRGALEEIAMHRSDPSHTDITYEDAQEIAREALNHGRG